jgi:putative ABC transport system permease protein
MIQSYLTIAWRNLIKNKVFSFINIFGLGLGFAAFIFIALYIVDELSYDQFYPNAKDTYRVHSDIRFGGADLRVAVTSDPFGETLKRDYPEVEQYTRVYANEGSKFIRRGEDWITENACAYADSTFFDIFPRPIIEGKAQTALNEPNTVAISRSAAEKYFKGSALGQTLVVGMEDKLKYKVAAVFEDIPANSHFRFDVLFSMHQLNYQFGNYLGHNFHTYVRLKKGTDPQKLEAKFSDLVDRYVFPQAQQFMQIKSREDFENAGNSIVYSLIPILDIHLKSGERGVELAVNGNIQYVRVFGIVALFLLLIASINFINLSTARSAKRSKEVGIRKVMGTSKNTLISQFLAESVLSSGISLVLALLLVVSMMPFFNQLAGKAFSWANVFQFPFFGLVLALPLVIGLLAGYYPAFFLSSFRPIEVLKSKVNAGFSKSIFRNVLVSTQFSISLLLIIATLIVYRQLNFIQDKNLGFNKDQVLVLNGTNALQQNNQAFKQELLRLKGVKGASGAGYLPVDNSSRSDSPFSKEATIDAKNGFNMQIWNVDEAYIPNLGMEIVEGRNFSKEFGTDSSGIIVNETALKFLDLEDPIGKTIYSTLGNPNGNQAYTIIGVVKNFHFSSLRHEIGPLAMRLGSNDWAMAFKIDAAESQDLIAKITAKWKMMAGGAPFSYQFLDESFNNMYRAEQRVGKIALCFAFLTILLACLGLFGLVTYMTEQRTKEIGIRKVLGASTFGITRMLSVDFLRLVLISILIASPLAWYFMHQWLKDFTYRIEIQWWIFALAGIGALVIAFLTLSFQSIRAALANPVKSLKSE